MKRFEIRSFEDDDSLAGAAAAAWVKSVDASNQAGRPQCVALSGGRIARNFFSAITLHSKEMGVSLGSVHFFWADERCVPSSDPESNFAVAQKLLFEPLSLPGPQIHRIRGEDPPQTAATLADEELRRFVRSTNDGVPILDYIFLGMGEDGHIASLFPDGPTTYSSAAPFYLPVEAPKPPPLRVSLNYPVIIAARESWVLAAGAGKTAAFTASLSGLDSTPLSRVLNRRSQTVFWTTQEIAGRYER